MTVTESVRRAPEPAIVPVIEPAKAADALNEQAEKRRSLRPLAGLLPYVQRYPWIVAGATLALIVSAATMLVVPLAVRRMIDFGFSSSDGPLIDQYFAMMIALGLLLAIASSSRFYFVNWLGERVVADLRRDTFAHLTRLGPSFFDQARSGEVLSRLTADTTQMKAAAGSTFSQALRNTIMLAGALTMMFITSAGLSLMVLVAIPVIVLPLMGYGRVVRRLSREAQDSLAAASAYAGENLAAVRTMQAFAHEDAVARRFDRAVQHSFDTALARLKARAALTGFAMFLVVASIVGVLWFGASAVVTGEMSGGRLSQFVLYALFAAGALAELAEVWGELSQTAGAAERIAELLAIKPDITSPAKPVSLPVPARGEIVFEDVSFAYDTGREARALTRVSFKVLPGETIAIVGPSGAGKTTLFNLLLRFYDPASGIIRFDGVDIRSVDLGDLRRRMSLVPQDVALFADSIFENIAYGSPDATLDDVQRAARAARADEFINDLPDGYMARVGERGITLSGGQRQRVALARAILKDAPVLLLDEATSALDAANEVAVQRALEQVMHNRTTLVIAHRLATVQKADRILVFDEGRIVETGTHTELLRRAGLYARLAELQFFSEAAE